MSTSANGPLRGVVFDLNGTLVDDIAYHFEAWKALAHERGVDMTQETFQSFNGLKNEDILPKLVGKRLSADETAHFVERKEEAYRRAYRPHLALLPGAHELLSKLRAAGIPVAIASSAPPENRAMVIDGLGLHAFVRAVVSTEHLPGKPAPDAFIEAARQLGIPPTECLAFEDAVAGVQSAVGARMLVGAVTTNNSAETLLAAGAAFAVRDFTSIPADVVARLVNA